MLTTDALLHLASNAEENGDFDRMRHCYERGAALGDADCLHALGYMYDIGEGVLVDKDLAMKLYRQAWRHGSQAAANNIAVLYREQGKPATMFCWFQRLASMNDGSGHLEVAKCYLGGIGVRKDVQAALRHLASTVQSTSISEYEIEEARALLVQLRPHLIK